MNSQLKPCPICGEGSLHLEQLEDETTYKGTTKDIPLYISVCDVCEVEQAGAEEMKLNKRAMIAFKKQVDGLLSGDQVRKMRENWDIDQRQAAKIFGGGPVAFSKYENDEVMQSEGMDKLLRLAEYSSLNFERLKTEAGIDSEGSRYEPIAIPKAKKEIHQMKVVARHDITNPACAAGYMSMSMSMGRVAA
jgi:HTH-type transcriptional regulator/antitoxin MqsA